MSALTLPTISLVELICMLLTFLSTDSCPQAKVRAGSSRSAQNYLQGLCENYKDEYFRWCLASFSKGEPQELRWSAALSHR